MDDPHTIRQIVWDRIWKLAEDVHQNSDKSGNLTTDQENKIEGLDIYLCSALEINRKDFPDPDGG
jgi:hypothetical protein|tara:strand:- start:1304 stop:1498 length:195 start_codon:yes stop_codon:yes gene_type:complete